MVEQWLVRGERRPTLCFAVDRAHAKHLETQFQSVGVRTGYIDAYTTKADRESIAGRFARGDIEVVCNVGCLTTGVDWDVRCVILARPTKSEMLYVQIIGRGLRTAPGKDHCLILDHSDTTQRLGFVTDIRHETLDDGRGRKKPSPRMAPEPKECPSCQFLRPAKMSTCPACGFKAMRQCAVTVEEGELIEMAETRAAQIQADKIEKQRWYSMLLYIGESRNYNAKWPDVTFRNKFGSWPNDSMLHSRRQQPTPDVTSYVRSRMIAFAKGRAA